MTNLLEYERPFLYAKQEAAVFTKERWALCEASTKSGKTVAAIARLIEAGFHGTAGQNFWWVAPVSDQSRIAFARVKQNLTPGSFVARESPTPQITLINGAILAFKSADNPDSLYGEDVFGVVMDEASRQKVDAWYAVRSTLTATRGWAVIIGNVKGRKNWFYDFSRRVELGQEPNGHFSRITWQDAVDAGVLDLEEIEDARRNLPDSVFRELYEAEASDDAGNPFGLDHIAACTTPEAETSNLPAVAFGIDLAKKHDYLVVIGFDEHGRVCQFHRWRGIPWRGSIIRIHEIVGEDVPALVDSTGVGDPVLEELQVGHGNFTGYNFSPSSKQKLMEGLAVSIQSHEISFPAGPIADELKTFEYNLTRTGVAYSAPEGFFDDCVCSLALARQQWTETQPGQNLIGYIRDEARRARVANDDDLRDEPGPERRPSSGAPSEDVVTNELTELYHATMREYEVLERLCEGCGEPISGASRVTDGHFVWHAEHSGLHRSRAAA